MEISDAVFQACYLLLFLGTVYLFLKLGTQLYKEVLMNDSHFMEPSTTPVILSLLIQESTPCNTDHRYFHGSHKYWRSCSLPQFLTCFYCAEKWLYKRSVGYTLTTHSSIHSSLYPTAFYSILFHSLWFLFMDLKDHTGGLGGFSPLATH